jgi:hypothetical protein
MASRRALSPQTICVLPAGCADPSVSRLGYTLAKQTGPKSGALYPILVGLVFRGLRPHGRTARVLQWTG